MGKRFWILLGLLLVVMPGFSDDPAPADHFEFYFTRVAYPDVRGGGGSVAGSSGFSRLYRGSWLTDAWDSDYKYMWGIQRMTNVSLSPDPHPLSIMDPHLFEYPYI